MLTLNKKNIEENKSINDIRIMLEKQGHNISIADQLWLKARIEKMRADNEEFARGMLNNEYFRTAITIQLKKEKLVGNQLIKNNKDFSGIDYAQALKDMVKIRNRKTTVEREKNNIEKRWKNGR
jgi:hypothetical protein